MFTAKTCRSHQCRVHEHALRRSCTAISLAAGTEQSERMCLPLQQRGGRKGEKCCKSCWGTQERRQRLWSLIRVSASSSSSGKLWKPTVSSAYSTSLSLKTNKRFFSNTDLHDYLFFKCNTRWVFFDWWVCHKECDSIQNVIWICYPNTHIHTNHASCQLMAHYGADRKDPMTQGD